jgi:23S rRNA G2445 N2-methylase RlmL
MIDTTGSSLFKRGYRVEKGGAPIKENMAMVLFYNYQTGIQINRLLILLVDRELSVLRQLC